MDDAFLDAELGPAIDFQPAVLPDQTVLRGRYVRLEPLNLQKHAAALYNEQANGDDRLWLYLPYGPFANQTEFQEYAEKMTSSADPFAYAVIPEGGEPAGILTYMRMDVAAGGIEIGHIWYGASIQRSPATTEVVYLTAKHAFEELGYRRFEWKCHNKNERSKRAALRFGFTFEGVFRNHGIMRHRNRDTAWYSITDEEWPAIKATFEAWLDPANFGADGQQIASLTELRQR